MTRNRSVLDWPRGTTVYDRQRSYSGFTIINPFLILRLARSRT